MTKYRCGWVNLENPKYIKYHDEVWGKIEKNDKKLFEMLILEGAQAGLSWETILNRKEGYYKAFDNFDIEKIINYDDKKIEKLRQDKSIIRNKLKIKSVVKNAKAFLEIQKEFGSFYIYLWGFIGNKQIKNNIKNYLEGPTQTDISEKISKDLKKRGMSFVGPKIIYAFMQATGMVNDHEENCFKIKK